MATVFGFGDLSPGYPKVCLPCGCFGWAIGGATGVVPCSFHAHLHYELSSVTQPCDCLKCRAEDAGVDPVTYVQALVATEKAKQKRDAEVVQYRVTEAVDHGADHKPDTKVCPRCRGTGMRSGDG